MRPIILCLSLSLLALASATAVASERAPARDGARLIAGLKPAEGSPLAKFTRNAGWRQYARQMDYIWKSYESRTLDPIKTWVAAELPDAHPPTIFYPFSGPDILNAVTFFPRGRVFLLFGLEQVGRIPADPGDTPEDIVEGVTALRETLDHLIGLNFFRTASMKTEVGAHPYSGVASLLMFFLTRTGHDILGARYIKLDDEGQPVEVKAHGARAVEITFHGPDDAPDAPARVVYYFRGDISDGGFAQNKGVQALINRQGPMVTFLKAASYLMYETAFDDIRATVLARSALIVSEASGVPFHALNTPRFAITLYGSYKGPVDVFEGKCQPDLAKAVHEGSKGRLPFSFGYSHLPGTSHLIVARRAADAPIEMPIFDESVRAGQRTHCDEEGKMSVSQSK
ncbi:MAG: hypothetical protein KC620_07805 [Myxococcales bacterium]|nr:hypothetical protein [Myxococcales bacterium]